MRAGNAFDEWIRVRPGGSAIASVLSPDGVSSGPRSSAQPARIIVSLGAMLRDHNRRQVFDNLADSEESIVAMLEQSFATVEVQTHDSVPVFTAGRRPLSLAPH